MTPDLQKEFQLLSKAAKQQLKDIPVSGSYRHVFSVWILPSFLPSRRWTVYLPHGPKPSHRPFASSTIWRSDVDLEKLKSPVERLKHPQELAPTIEGEAVWLTEGVIDGYERRLRHFSIPFFLGNPSHAGCDGTQYKFNYDQWQFGGSLHWWETFPEEWRPFTDEVLKIVNDLNERKAAAVSQMSAY